MLLFPALLASVPLQKDRTETLGLSYAGILKLGPSRWEELVLKRQGDSTMATAGGFSTYGDALAWRNDGLLKRRAFPLRKHLRDFSNDVQGVGYARTQGGTMWSITAGQYHRDVEEAVYRTLTHTGRAPHRVVSDVTQALDRLQRVADRTEAGRYHTDAKAAMVKARADLRLVVADAKSLPRRDSDTVLDFCREATLGIEDQAKDL